MNYKQFYLIITDNYSKVRKLNIDNMILDNNTHTYSSLVANYRIKQDCDRINMLIKHFDHLMLYIIHLGFKQIINVIK